MADIVIEISSLQSDLQTIQWSYRNLHLKLSWPLFLHKLKRGAECSTRNKELKKDQEFSKMSILKVKP